MTRKEQLTNDILVGMQYYLDGNTLDILKNVIICATKNIDIVELETLPATVDNSNDYIKNLFMVKKGSKLSKHTVNYYLNTVDELITFSNKSLLQVTEYDIELYLLEKRKQGNTNTSLNNLKRNLSAFFTFMRKCKLISENPCDGIDNFKQTQKEVDHLEPVEIDELRNACLDPRERAIIEFLRCTACRRGEIPNIKIKDIDFSTGKLIIFGQKTLTYRTVWLDDIALKYIKLYLTARNISLDSDGPLFAYKHAEKEISGEGIYGIVKKIAKRSGLKHGIYPHLFRKTCATAIVRRGGSDDDAGSYLGHKPKTVTGNHYIHKSEQQMELIFKTYVASV